MPTKNTSKAKDDFNPFVDPQAEDDNAERAAHKDGDPSNPVSAEPDVAPGRDPEPEPEVKADKPKRATRKKSAEPDWTDTELLRKLPFDAKSGTLRGSIKMHNGHAVAVVSFERWVGEPPLTIGANQLDDLAKVVEELKAQASA